MTRSRMGLLPGLLLVLALAVAGCGGGGNSNGMASNAGSSQDELQAALDWARCMRQHGINLPDPKMSTNGGVTQLLPKGVNPDDSKFKDAEQACQQYLPNGGQAEGPDPQQQQQMLAYARCMRQHGINLPDPTPDGGIDERGIGIDPDGPKFKAAEQTCQQQSGYGDGR
jgi:hypothetical protein